MNPIVSIEQNKIENFCRRWKICELSLFGSVLGNDFSLDSDIDVLVNFFPEADWGLLDHAQMQDELKEVFGRNVDLVSYQGLVRSKNWIRKHEILETAEVLYATR